MIRSTAAGGCGSTNTNATGAASPGDPGANQSIDPRWSTSPTPEETAVTRRGLLTKDRFAPVAPVHAPAYHIAPTIDFGDVDMLTFTYLTDAASAAQIVPDALELDDHPVVTLSFLDYGISGAGSYREVVQSIACHHREQTVGYVPHIYVTNEPAMIAGREWLGWPKMMADITFSARTATLDGLITARLERPAGLTLAVAQFVPTQRLDSQILTAAGDNVTMNLRVIPRRCLVKNLR